MDIGHREVCGSVEGELHRESWRGLRDWGSVMASGRLLDFLVALRRLQLVLTVLCLMVEVTSLVDELCGQSIAAMIVGHLRLRILALHDSSELPEDDGLLREPCPC